MSVHSDVCSTSSDVAIGRKLSDGIATTGLKG